MRTHRIRVALLLGLSVIVLLFASASVEHRIIRGGSDFLKKPPGSETQAPENTPSETIQRAWQLAKETGAYHFNTEIVQTTHLAPRLVNVGRSSRVEKVYLEGSTNLDNRSMQLALYENGGNLLNLKDGVEVRIDDDRAYGRALPAVGDTGWEQIDDFSDAFAPTGDLLAYLAGTKNARFVEEAQTLQNDTNQWNVSVPQDHQLVAFDLDGPAFAAYLRQQLEAHLRAKGELPIGITLDISEQYRQLDGGGYVLIDQDGLPSRLSILLEYPQTSNGERMEAVIKTDFSSFAREQLAASSTEANNTGFLSKAVAATGNVRNNLYNGIILSLFSCGIFGLVILNRKSKIVYVAFVGTMIFSMVVTPLLQSQQVFAYTQEQIKTEFEQEQQQNELEEERAWEENLLDSTWDPHHPHWLADTEQIEAQIAEQTIAQPIPYTSYQAQVSAQTSTTPDPESDEDNDGLTYQEELRVGTDPDESDTDSDGLRDDMEVKGFTFGQKWYSDPLNPDTNNDGQLDTLECWVSMPNLANPSNKPCDLDTDKDGTPDLFDRDNDGDGVPDRVDLAPSKALGSASSPFSRENPFKLVVSNLKRAQGQEGYPVFVDFQVRPTNPQHLTFAMNVLDWPTGDTEGQIQRTTATTFASTMTDAQISAMPSAANGDMRLVPMLEIRIPADNGSLKNIPLTTPLAERELVSTLVEVDKDTKNKTTITTTVSLDIELEIIQSGGNTAFSFKNDVDVAQVKKVDKTVTNVPNPETPSLTATLYKSTCPVLPNTAYEKQSSLPDNWLITKRMNDLVDGEHAIVYTMGDESTCFNLGDIPNGPYRDQMIDLDKLTTHAISIRDEDKLGNVVAYVPLNVVKDELGGDDVAFTARMLYWPNRAGDWGKANEVRVVWLIQLLDDNGAVNIVHSYPESFVLTGLDVREDRGLKLGVLFEDPSKETGLALKSDDSLWKVADGLQNTFTAARDDNNDGKRDITIEEIKSRFDNQSNTSITNGDVRLWGISRDALQVKTYTYDHQDYIAKLPSELTPEILEENFSHDSIATLMFVREETYRYAGLGMNNGVVAIQGNQVTINMASDKIPVDVLAGMNWGPFHYADGGWQAYPLKKYQDYLGVTLKEVFKQNPPLDIDGKPLFNPNAPDADNILTGLVTTAKASYFSMNVGKTAIPQSGTALATAKVSYGTSDDNLAKQTIQTIGGGIEIICDGLLEDFVNTMRERTETLQDFAELPFADDDIFDTKSNYKRIGQVAKDGVKDKLSSLVGGSETGIKKKAYAGASASASAAVAIGSLAFSISGSFTGIKEFDQTAKALGVIGSTMDMVSTFQDVLKTTKQLTKDGVRGFNQIKGASKSISRGSMYAGAALTVVAVGVTIGFFMASMISAGVEFASLAFNAALADTIATVIATVVLFAISLIPVVGQIIAAVIAVVDAVINLICSFLSEKDKKSVKIEGGGFKLDLCGGLSGLLTEVIRWNIFSQNSLVGNLHDKSRLVTGNFNPQLVDVNKGYSVGNSINYRMDVKTSITLADVPIDWKAAAYFWQYSEKNLQSATFRYQLQAGQVDFFGDISKPEDGIEGVDRGDMQNDWKEDGTIDGDAAFRNVQSVAVVLPVPDKGINQRANLFLTETYATPTQECWIYPTTPPIPVCYLQTEDNTSHTDLGKQIKWDVFPSTLDEFYACNGSDPEHACNKDGGFTLGWGQEGPVTFPRMKDFDGDGMLSTAVGGSDPDDSLADSDGDHLSDPFEAEQGTNPSLSDTDGDGLSDYEELLIGSQPTRVDSDGDGLSDKEEVTGWEFVYAINSNGVQEKTWVTSNPNSIDSDEDLLTDFQEYVYGFHPGVYTDPTLMDYESKVLEKSAPIMLLHFDETSNNNLFSDSSFGPGVSAPNNVTCSGSTCPSAGHLGRFGNAPNFSSDKLEAKINTSDGTAYGVSLWVKTNAQKGHLLSLGNRNVYLQSGNVCASVNSQVICASGNYSNDQWHHIVHTFGPDIGGQKLYVNGQLAANHTGSYSAPSGATNITIGYGTTGGYFDGRIDEVAVFEYALQAENVSALREGRHNYNDKIVKPGQNLVYEGTATNELLNRYVNGLLYTDLPANLQGDVAPQPFILYPGNQTSLVGDITVSDSANSGKLEVSQVAVGTVVNRRQESGYAELYLPFNENQSATQFVDFSGIIPSRNAKCSGSTCPTAGFDGVIGSAIDFDGSNDYLTTANKVDLANKSFTVAFWANVDETDNTKSQYIVSQGINKNNQGFYFGYRNRGFTCAFNGNDLDARSEYDEKAWHHWACTYDATTKTRKIYRDGELLAQDKAEADYQGEGPIVVGKLAWDNSNYFGGKVDDVRIYPRAFSLEEIALLGGGAIMHLPLNENGSNTDAVNYYDDSKTKVADCWAGVCPIQTPGISGGNGQYFDGTELIWIQPYAPDLSPGAFTLAGWIYPDYDQTDQRYDLPQGIWGYDWGKNNGYPSLALDGTNLIFGFGDGSNWYERTTTNSSIRLKEWNFIVTAFDGTTYKLYVNGRKIDEFSGAFNGKKPFRTGNQYVGADLLDVKLTVDTLFIENEGDGEGKAEICISWKDRMIYENLKVDDNDDKGQYYTISIPVENYKSGTLKVWEDDNDKKCEDKPDGDDDRLVEQTFYHYDTSNKPLQYAFDKDGTKGYLSVILTHHTPFKGKIDEYSVYRRALAENEVVALYESAYNIVQMSFDEPPGVEISGSGFHNALDITGQDKATCISGSCPTSGVLGRAEQGILLDGTDDYLTLKEFSDYGLTKNDFSVSVWMKSDSSRYGTIIANKDWESGFNKGFVLSTKPDGTWIANVGDGSSRADATGDAVSDGKWHHLVATFDRDGQMTIYQDGKNETSVDMSSVGSLNTPTPIVIGADSTTSHDYHFKGSIDELRIYRRILSADEVASLYGSVPVISLGFNEQTSANGFADLAKGDLKGTCSGDTCPKLGESGRLSFAASFDGNDDKVTIGTPETLGLYKDEFTVMAWIKGDKIPSSGIIPILGVTATDNTHHLLMGIKDGKAHIDLFDDDSLFGTYDSVTGNNTIQEKYWYHLAFRYRNRKLAVFVNGYLDQEILGSRGYQFRSDPVTIGEQGSNHFDGLIDHLVIYGDGLTDWEIRDAFLYQGRQVEDRQNHIITVDNESPRSTLESKPANNYIPLQDTIMHVSASDTSSYVAMVELGVTRGETIWYDAPKCDSSTTTAAWCPSFDPEIHGGEGALTIQTRAVDAVGHRETPSAGTTLYVDGTAPTIGFSQAANALLSPVLDQAQSSVWRVLLSGTVTDPALINTSVAGSGVHTSKMEISLRQTDAADWGEIQLATVQNGSWNIAYPLYDANPSGQYLAKVTAQDMVGNTATVTLTFNLDATPPGAELDLVQTPKDMITQTLTLYGQVQDTLALPSPLARLHLDEPAGSTTYLDNSGLKHHATCSGITCPTAGQTGVYVSAVQFNGTDDRLTLKDTIALTRTNYTFAGWFNTTSTASGSLLAGNDGTADLLHLQLESNGQIQFDHRTNSNTSIRVNSGDTFNDGKWHHYAVVKNGTSLYLYLDGKQLDETEGVDALKNPVTITLGAGFDGMLDEVEIFGHAIDAVSIKALAQTNVTGVKNIEIAFTPLSGTEPFYKPPDPVQAIQEDPVLYLPLDDLVDQNGNLLIADESGQGHNGSCSGASCPTSGQSGHTNAAMEFDGYNDYIQIPEHADYSFGTDEDFSISLWMKTPGWNGDPAIISNKDWDSGYNDGFVLAAKGNGKQWKTNIGANSGANQGRVDLSYEVYDTYNLPNPSLHLEFTEPVGDIVFADSSGKGNFATCSGGNCPTAGETGKSGQGLLFDGYNDYIVTGNGIHLNNRSFTVAVWAKRNSIGTLDFIIGQGEDADSNGFVLGFRKENTFTCGFWGNDLDTPAYTDTDWHHWACTYDYYGKVRKVYRDGVLVVQDTNVSAFQGSGNFYIGKFPAYENQFSFDGYIDEVIVLPQVLSGNEIEKVMDARYIPSPDGINDNQWHHLVATFDRDGDLVMYQDGVEMNRTKLNAGTATSGKPIAIGQDGTLSYNYSFPGLIDEVRIYDFVLSLKEITALNSYSGPSMPDTHIPFENLSATDGAIYENVEDNSRTGVLHTNSADNHAVHGSVGYYALSLDGVDDYLAIENGVTLTSKEQSVCMWVRPEVGNAAGAVIAQRWADYGNNWALRMGDQGFAWQHGALTNRENIQSTEVIPGNWYHLCGIAEATRQVLYVNGERVNAGWTNNATGTGYGLNLGRQVGSTANAFKGEIDDLHIFPRAISKTEVDALYQRGWQAAVYLPPGSTASTRTNRAPSSTTLECTTYTSSDTPVPIRSRQTSYSEIVVADEFTVDDINLTMDIIHTYDLDLSGYLIAPNGTEIALFPQQGGSYDNYTNTQLDAEASNHITDGSPPYTGLFRPQDDLSSLNGFSSKGTWQLKVYDHYYGDIGDITSWSLELCSPPLPPAPKLMTELGNYITQGFARKLDIAGDYAYIIDNAIDLQVIDITDPTDPRPIAMYDTPSTPQGIDIAGNHAYLANGYNGLRIVNIAEPNDPVEVAVYESPVSAVRDVFVAGQYAYVGFSDKLMLLDITNPASPVEVGTFESPDLYAYDVFVQGTTAYVSDGFGGNLYIVDVSNPQAPSQLARYATGTPLTSIDAVGDLVYLANFDEGLRILDVSDPRNPFEVSVIDTPGYALNAKVFGDYAYVSDGSEGVRIFDVSDPANPISVDFYDTPGTTLDLIRRDVYAYIADGYSGLRLLSVDLPPVPIYIPPVQWEYQVPTGLEGNYRIDLRATDQGGIVDNTSNSRGVWQGEIDTLAPRVDITRQVVGNKYRYTSSAEDYNLTAERFNSICGAGIYKNETYVDAVEGYDDVQRLYRLTAQCDFALPPLEEIGALDTAGKTLNLALVDDTLFVADFKEGLRVMDVSDPTLPVEIAQWKPSGNYQVGAVRIVDDYAYIQNGYSNFIILDISDLNNINQVGSYRIYGQFVDNSVPAVHGDYAYLPSNSENLIEIANIADPENPVKVGIKQIDLGVRHSCILTYLGGIKCWGDNEYGQLGDGTFNRRLTPVDVPGLTSGVEAIAVGGLHTCALLDDSSVKCWGRNAYGQIGIGSTEHAVRTPQLVSALGNSVVSITAGGNHTCALLSDETVKCWGYNPSGQLGDGTRNHKSTPTEVSGLGSGSGVTMIAAGDRHTCALIWEYRLECWGENSAGQLGNNSNQTALTPVQVEGLQSFHKRIYQIELGNYHSCVRTQGESNVGGDVYCWGWNHSGQLGDGTTTNRWVPTHIDNSVEHLTVGGFHTCAAYAYDSLLRCWGANTYGQLGNGTTSGQYANPVDVIGAATGSYRWGRRATALASGDRHTCAIIPTGLKCWGYNYYGQLGDNSTSNRSTPVDIANLPIGELDLVKRSGSGATKISIYGDYAYATAEADGLFIVDIRNPEIPILKGSYTGPTYVNEYNSAYKHYVEDVAVSGNYAYLANSYEGLVVLDITNKNNPYKIGQFNPRHINMTGISLSGTYAYMVDNYGGVWLIDIINPRSPRLVQHYDLDMNYSAVVADGNDAYIAARAHGVRVAHSDLREATEKVTACDTFGHCVTKSITETNQLPRLPLEVPVIGVALQEKPDDVVTVIEPISMTGYTQADFGLHSLVATINNELLSTKDWSTNIITTTRFDFVWTPPEDGYYLLDITVQDTLTNTASYTQVVTVDTQVPQISITTDQLTSVDYTETGDVLLTGHITETNLNYIDVVIQKGDQTWEGQADVEGQTWTYTWGMNMAVPPDGEDYNVSVTAVDTAGWETETSRTILVDVVAPQGVESTLIDNRGGIGTTLTPDAIVITQTATTIEAISSTLVLSWTTGSSKDIAGYQVGWTTQSSSETSNPPIWETFAQTDALVTARAFSGDAQKLTVNLVTEDDLGNPRWQTAGEVYLDTPLTPDYVHLPTDGQSVYRGWLESGCTLVGIDNRIRDHAQEGAALSFEQRFYTSWDTAGLRLSWTGANWDTDGDLFIYLDTQAGGTTRAYNPYTATLNNTMILLPNRQAGGDTARRIEGRQVALQSSLSQLNRTQIRAEVADYQALDESRAPTSAQMGADYLVWVKDSSTAVLLQWNNDTNSWQAMDSEWSFLNDTNLTNPHTGVYLPFDTLGIVDAASSALSLVAFASENEALRLWATMPSRNSVTSDLVLDAVNTATLTQFPLLQRYDYPSLGSGVCPNGRTTEVLAQAHAPTGWSMSTRQQNVNGQIRPFSGADLHFGLQAEPSGIAYSILGDNLFNAMGSLSQFSALTNWDAVKAEICQLNPEDPVCERAPETGDRSANALTDKAAYTRANLLPPPPNLGSLPDLRSTTSTEGSLDYNASSELNTVKDVRQTALGDGQTVTYTLRFVNRGEDTATGVMVDILTWGQMRLPAGIPLSDEFGDYDWLLLPLGNLEPGEETEITFVGRTDFAYDQKNDLGWASVDIIIYDDTGSVYNNQLDWMYLDHKLDQTAPLVGLQANPALLRSGENTLTGTVFDQSGVPSIEISILDERGREIIRNCANSTPDNGQWACTLDLGAQAEGSLVSLRARATDEHGHTGPWTTWQKFTIDATPPELTFSTDTLLALEDQLLGPRELLLAGNTSDNREVALVEVCSDGDTCTFIDGADLVIAPETVVDNTYIYQDVPDSPLPLGEKQACYGGTEIFRTFNVPDSFTVADVNLGLNIDHTYRHDVTAWLVAPSGTWSLLLWEATSADNLDITLDDTAQFELVDDDTGHDSDAPYYENVRRPATPLNNFYGEQAAGTWQLILCDYFPEKDEGTYNRSQLTLTSTDLPENAAGSWTYDLSNIDLGDYISKTLTFFATDFSGNRSQAGRSAEIQFWVDTVAPVITVTEIVTTTSITTTVEVLGGQMFDGGEITNMFALVQIPSGLQETVNFEFTNEEWTFALQPREPGQYAIWINALDAAGNTTIAGPYQVDITNPTRYTYFLPVIFEDYASPNENQKNTQATPVPPAITPTPTPTPTISPTISFGATPIPTNTPLPGLIPPTLEPLPTQLSPGNPVPPKEGKPGIPVTPLPPGEDFEGSASLGVSDRYADLKGDTQKSTIHVCQVAILIRGWWPCRFRNTFDPFGSLGIVVKQ